MTVTQMRYFLTLTEKTKEKNRNIAEVARMFQVNRSTVSRAIAPFVNEGVLDEKFMLTEKGTLFLKKFDDKYNRIQGLLKAKGIQEEQAKQDALLILVECSEETSEFISRISID